MKKKGSLTTTGAPLAGWISSLCEQQGVCKNRTTAESILDMVVVVMVHKVCEFEQSAKAELADDLQVAFQ